MEIELSGSDWGQFSTKSQIHNVHVFIKSYVYYVLQIHNFILVIMIYVFRYPQLTDMVTDNVNHHIAHSSVCRRLQVNVIHVTSLFVTLT